MKTNIIAKVNDVNIVCIGSEELIPVLHLAQALGIKITDFISAIEDAGLEDFVGLQAAMYEREAYTCIPLKYVIGCIFLDGIRDMAQPGMVMKVNAALWEYLQLKQQKVFEKLALTEKRLSELRGN